MSTYWTPPPNFEAGQIASAAGHLNALGNGLNHLLGMYLSPKPLITYRNWPDSGGHFNNGFGRYPTGGGDGEIHQEYRRIYTGWIRHKANTLAYSLTVTADSVLGLQIRINYGPYRTTLSTVAGGSGTSTVSGTLDVTGLATEFYKVSYDVRFLSGSTPTFPTSHGAAIHLNYFQETDAKSYTAPAAFTTGSTPTAANWQLLSDTATTLYSQLRAPRPLMSCRVHRPRNSNTDIAYDASMTYLHRYLYYDIRLRAPHNDSTLTAKLYVNGSQVGSDMAVDQSNRWTPGESGNSYAEGDFTPFIGAADLNSLGLTVGNTYRVHVTVTHSGIDDSVMAILVNNLHQQPASTPTVTGWTNPPTWARGTSVTGTASAKVLRDDLVWLTDRVVYRNQVSDICRHDDHYQRALWGIRYHSVLWYRSEPLNDDDTMEPTLGYWFGGEWKEHRLNYKPNEWQSANLDAIDGLMPGAIYRLTGVTAGVEDVI